MVGCVAEMRVGSEHQGTGRPQAAAADVLDGYSFQRGARANMGIKKSAAQSLPADRATAERERRPEMSCPNIGYGLQYLNDGSKEQMP